MLRIAIEDALLFNNETQEFITPILGVVDLEHSLVSLSKWEAQHQKPFLSSGGWSGEEVYDYVKAMVITPDVPDELLQKMNEKNFKEIQEYIDSPQSATVFNERPKKGGKVEVITSELIYYWMVAAGIPFECQHWHLNRLLALIRIWNIKNSKPEQRSRGEIARERAAENERRLAMLKTSG